MDKKVQDLIELIKTLPDGTSATTARLLLELGYPVRDWNEEMFHVHFSLMEEAEKQGIELDMSKHNGKLEGLPYNLDFIIRREYNG